MKHLKSYKMFEAFGVAEATLVYNDFLIEEYTKFFQLNFNKVKELKKSKKFEEVKDYTTEDLMKFTQSDFWVKMPISSMKVEYELEVLTDDEFVKKYPRTSKDRNYIGTGGCYPYTEGTKLVAPIDDRTENCIHLRVMVGSVVSQSFTDLDSLIVEIESSITHELNHAYEGYNRLVRGKGEISTDVTHSLDINRARVRKDIWNAWYEDIGFLLYWSEPHEMNAMIQDAYPFVRRYDVDKMKQVTPSWKFAQRMIDFNATDFKKKMIDKITSFYPDANPEVILKRIKAGFANELAEMRETSIKFKEDKPTISKEMIENLSVDKFLEFVQKRANYSGRRIQKKILNLYSLKFKQ